jgi:hypothetical protein
MFDSLIKSSFDTVLKLHQVILCYEVITVLADIWTEIPSSKEQAGVHYGMAG